jgi:phospholipid/cholesterol/gamma-HCH transport system substrate-binding protein
MITFRDRNQVVVGLVGTAIIAGLVAFAISFRTLPLFNPRSTYYADFANAAELASGDQVSIAGIAVGTVTGTEVRGAHARVAFTVKKGVSLGRATAAHIKIGSVLGQKYLDLQPAGGGRLPSGATIPESRTTTPYTLLGALGDLSQDVQQIDLGRLRASIAAVSAALDQPADVPRQLLDGLARLSTTLAERKQGLAALVDSSDQVAATLASRQSRLVALLGDGDLVLQMLEQRRDLIHQLLVDTTNLGDQINGLIATDGARLAPLLADLKTATDTLVANQGALAQTISTLAPFVRGVTNAGGSGTWTDLITPTVLLPDSLLAACTRAGGPGLTGCSG